MIHLLYPLSWFLLGMCGSLYITILMTLILKKKKPETAFIMSKLSLALSGVAALTVIFCTGYISMKLNSANDEEICSFFGLKKNPNAIHTNSLPKVNASAASVFWMVLTEDCIMLDKVLIWISFCLCIGAIFSLLFVLNKGSDPNWNDRVKEANIALITSLMKGHIKKYSPHHDAVAAKMKKSVPQCTLSPMKFHLKSVPPHAFPAMKKRTFEIRAPLRQVQKSKWTLTATMAIFSTALIGTVLLNRYYTVRKDSLLDTICISQDIAPLKYMESSSPTYNNTKGEIPSPFHIVSREEWRAMPPKDSHARTHPANHVVVTLTPSGSCSTHHDCIEAVRAIQATNMGPGDGMRDISSNFLIAGDGRAYMGRGWNTRADDAGYFANDSITVMFMGTAINAIPTKCQIQAFNDLIGEGIRAGHIAQDVKIVMGRKDKKSKLKALFN